MRTKYILTTLLLVLSSVTQLLSATYIWTGTSSTNWDTTSNWSPAGIPVAADYITLNSNAPNNLVLDQNRTVANFTINGDTVDLGTYTLTTTGVTYFNGGLVSNGNLNISGSLCHFGGATINARIEASCGYYHMNGGVFLKPVVLVSSGTSNTTGTGNSIFEDSLTITHSGVFYFTMGSSTNDFFNGPVTITNHATKEVYMANGDSSFYNANVTISSTGNGGVAFGNGGGVSVLASGKTISIGSGGFGADYLTLKRLKQLGTTAQTLTLTGTAIVNLVGCEFNGNLTLSAGGFLLKDDVFKSASTFTKTGTANCHSDGNNTYNGATSFVNNGSSGRLRLSATEADVYSDHVSFNSTGQDVQVCYTGNNYFYKNVTINSNKVVFNTSTGKVTLAGDTAQSLNGSYNYAFKKLAINKNANQVTANTTLSVDDTLFFVSGNLITTATNLLTMKAGSKVSGASSNSFVSGPVKKIGNTAFQFPVGKNNQFRSVEITAPTNATDAFTAEYFDTTQALGSTMDTTLTFISDCGYWNLSRTAGTSNITPKLAFDSTHCDYLTVKPVHITFWDGTKWTDKGEGVNDSNTKKTNAAVTSYGNFALAYKLMPGDAPQMPYELTSTSTCNPVEMLFENSDLWFSFEVDSALIKLGIFAPDPNKWYAPLKELIVYENYNPGADLISVMDWQMDCDSSLFSFQTFTTALDTSKKYLAKFSKYEMGDCNGISDTTNYYLNICLRNLRMFTGSTTYIYNDVDDLFDYLGTPSSTGSMNAGDVLIPGLFVTSIDISSVAPLVVDGVILSGDYDLIDNPEGTLLFSRNRGSFANQVLDNAGYMFIMRGGSTIRNLRLRGAMTGYIDYNEDVTLCSGVRMENEPMGLTGPYVISHCELYNFSCKAIYARANTDQVTVENCYIHHVKSTDNGRSNKGYGLWIDGINNNSNLTGTATTFAITNCIFDECKEALDAQPNPVDIIIQECTFGTFFSNEAIKKHKYNDLKIYNHPTLGQPFYDDHTPPCSSSTSSNIGNPASGNVTILKSLFYLEGEKNYPISLPYPADFVGLNTSPTPDKVYQVTISENTFSKAYDIPGTLACQFGGYARLQENYLEESVWEYERTHGVNGQTSSTTNKPILINAPNAFSYAAGESVASQCADCVQPPEVNFAFDNVAGYVPGFTFNSDPIAYVNEGDNIKINLTTGSLGVSKVSYVVRPHPNNAAAAGNNQSSNNGYDLAQQIVGPTDNPITLEYGPITSLPEWNTDRPGLYGVDVFAVDGTTNSAYHASKMVYQPIIVAPHHNYNLIFNIKDSYYADLYDTPGTSTGVYKQVELNGNVIWREEISEGGDDWEYVSINLMTDSYDGDPIKNYFNTKSFKNTITFSIAMPDYEDVSTSTVRGVLVWVDDVYLKKYDSAQNLISDGGVEHTTKSTFSVNPEVANIWYMTNAQDLSAYFTLDAAEFPGVSAEVNANSTSTERKSGFQAIRLKLPSVWAGSVGSGLENYSSIQPFPNQTTPANGVVVSAAVDFDYRDFLGCDDLTTNLTGTNLFVSFPDEPYSDSNGDPLTLTEGKFYIDRDITLRSNNSLNNPDNLIIEGCQIVVLSHNPPWKIIVEHSAKLNIVPLILGSGNPGNNSTRIFGCETMWGGILNSGGIIDMYNMPGSSNVYTPSSNPTEIEDAIVAIESDGGRLDLRFVSFDNNYKSFLLYEEDYDFVGAPFIKGCNFTCSVGSLEKYPYQGWEPNTHIELQNIDNVTFTIGGSAALRNNFSGAAYGIKSLNSSLNIENNLFTNMVRDDDQYFKSNDGTAILASTTTTGNTIHIFGGNEFEDSPQAITFYGNIESEITGNSFSNLLRGININNNASALNNIYDNTFTSVSTAVIGRNITGNFQVYGNTFENTVPATISSMPYNSFNSTAVTIQNSGILTTGLKRVFGNTIDDYRIGIHGRNIQNLSIGSDLISANTGTPNVIAFNQTSFDANHRGIWLENCPDAQIQENNISKTNPSTPSGTFTVEGIFHTLSPRGLINWNVLDQIQIPIHIRDDCSATELHCNNINNDPDPGLGVFLTSAVLPDQGSAATPWNNRWFGYDNTTFLGVNTDAPGNQFTWFYQTPGVEFNPYPDPFAALSQSTSSTGITCAVETAPDDPDRDVRYGDIVEDSLSFVDYVDEFTYKSKQYLFEQINADTNLLVRNTSKDTLFSEFYSNFKLSNIGLFLRVDSLILAGNFDTAFTLNSSILDTNQIESNQKAVNGILVTKVLRDSVLNESDSTTLQEIAIQDPILGGKAVFIARAILFEEIHDILPALRMSSPANHQPIAESPKSSFALFPNPATDRCEIHFLNLENDFILEIRNSLGQLIYYKKIAAKTSSCEIALTKFSPGFFLVSVNDGVAIFDQKKLIIAK